MDLLAQVEKLIDSAPPAREKSPALLELELGAAREAWGFPEEWPFNGVSEPAPAKRRKCRPDFHGLRVIDGGKR